MAKLISNKTTVIREKVIETIREGIKEKDMLKMAKAMAREMAKEMATKAVEEILAKMPRGGYPIGEGLSEARGIKLDESIADVSQEAFFNKSAEIGKNKISKEKASGKASKLKALLNKKK